MATLTIDGFRTFRNRTEINLTPLTLLFGPPNSGKTTILAALAGLDALLHGAVPNFNDAPFKFGSFDQIATDNGGSFMLRGDDLPGPLVALQATFEPAELSQPAISTLETQTEHGTLVLSADHGARWGTANGSMDLDWTSSTDERWIEPRAFYKAAMYAGFNSDPSGQAAHALTSVWGNSVPAVTVMAAQRVPWMRTYNPAQPVFSPYGEHVAYRLHDMLTAPQDADTVSILRAFGESAGCWSDLAIHRFGRARSNPFQIDAFDTDRVRRNVIDHGHSVGHALSIAVDVLSATPDDTLLMMHPEGALDTRAQRALGSLLVTAAKRGTRMVVETSRDVARGAALAVTEATGLEDVLSVLELSRDGTPSQSGSGIQIQDDEA